MYPKGKFKKCQRILFTFCRWSNFIFLRIPKRKDKDIIAKKIGKKEKKLSKIYVKKKKKLFLSWYNHFNFFVKEKFQKINLEGLNNQEFTSILIRQWRNISELNILQRNRRGLKKERVVNALLVEEKRKNLIMLNLKIIII